MNFARDKIKLKAYAKINLALYITGIRRDGYHLLDSVFVPVGIYDEITIKKAGSGINIKCGKDIPPDERNTACKAAKLIAEAADINGVDIEIKKNIPVMAGLGGGSADAAAVLIGINELYGLDMDRETLAGMGLEIGADVPFFLGEGASRVRGIGEIAAPVEMKNPIHMVIIKPEASLLTAEVYKKYDETAQDKAGDCDRLVESLKGNDLSRIAALLHNDLQAVAEILCPAISASAVFLKSNGAFGAIMTGSGSCVLGIFASESHARGAVENYRGNGKAYAARSVKRPVSEII